MRKILSVAAGLLIAADLKVWAQPSVPTGPTVVDLEDATKQFVAIFERSCYRNRHGLGKLSVEPPSAEFEKLPHAYPVRDETQKSSLLAEWGVWLKGVPYTVALLRFDSHPDQTTCAVFGTVVQKGSLSKSMLSIDGLYLYRSVDDENNKYEGIMKKSESDLRILCTTPKVEQLYNGHCSLSVLPSTGS